MASTAAKWSTTSIPCFWAGCWWKCRPCPACEGRGFVQTPETVCNEIFREIVRQSRQFASRELLILAHQDVVDRLLDEESATLGELGAQVGRPIRLQVEALYSVDQYDVVLV